MTSTDLIFLRRMLEYWLPGKHCFCFRVLAYSCVWNTPQLGAHTSAPSSSPAHSWIHKSSCPMVIRQCFGTTTRLSSSLPQLKSLVLSQQQSHTCESWLKLAVQAGPDDFYVLKLPLSNLKQPSADLSAVSGQLLYSFSSVWIMQAGRSQIIL